MLPRIVTRFVFLLLIAAVVTVADSTPAAESRQDSDCRARAEKECEGSTLVGGDPSECVSKQSFDCEMGQTPEGMRERYTVAPETGPEQFRKDSGELSRPAELEPIRDWDEDPLNVDRAPVGMEDTFLDPPGDPTSD